MYTVLFAEDDVAFRQTVHQRLEREKLIIFATSTGQCLVNILQHHKVDFVVLDISCAYGSAREFVKRIQAYTHAPLLITNDHSDTHTKVELLDAGAVDYLSKPYDAEELVARIHSHLKHHRTHDAAIFSVGGWRLDDGHFQLYNTDGQSAELTINEFRLIKALMRKQGRPVAREELCEELRQSNYVPAPRAIDIKITRIRKKLSDNAEQPALIKTVRGIGYVLLANK